MSVCINFVPVPALFRNNRTCALPTQLTCISSANVLKHEIRKEGIGEGENNNVMTRKRFLWRTGTGRRWGRVFLCLQCRRKWQERTNE